MPYSVEKGAGFFGVAAAVGGPLSAGRAPPLPAPPLCGHQLRHLSEVLGRRRQDEFVIGAARAAEP